MNKNIMRIAKNLFVIKQSISLILLLILFGFVTDNLYGQMYPASPANWLFLEGNSSATKNITTPSAAQSMDSVVLKWSTPLISGQVQPLIGNIINNGKLYQNFTYAPNEIAAVMGDRIVILNGNGKLAKNYEFPTDVNGIKGISLLLDTLSPDIRGSNLPCVLVTESMEASTDSIAHSYIFTYNTPKDTLLINRRLAVDMRAYKPNIYCSLKPFAGKLYGNDIILYATANTHTPYVPNQNPPYIPFLRGLLQFNISTLSSSYPLPDVGDNLDYRITMGPEVNRFSPSIATDNNGKTQILLPTLPSKNDSITVQNPVTFSTISNRPYIVGFDASDNSIKEGIFPRDFSALKGGTRPLIRSYLADLTDEASGDNMFVLVTEEYSGLDGSDGISKLHLYTKDGDPITFPDDPVFPPIVGGKNHYWSIAMGNVDGNSWNEWKPYFPNNPGKELVVSQSTKDFAYPTNRLMILRYQTNGDFEKPSPPNTYLNRFDTICTQRINGWVAAVNDFDGNPDGKEEIFLVDGGTVRVLRMRDYKDEYFRLGRPFDTVYTHTFQNQTIFSLEVADLEGDNKNEMIITTNDSTYVFGSTIPNTLKIIYPKEQQSPPETLCYGDTLQIKWNNFTLSEQSVKLGFQTTSNGLPTNDTLQIINSNLVNNADTVIYNLVVDEKLSGKEGFFVVSGNKNPSKNSDTSAIMSFEIPRLNLDDFTKEFYRIGDKISISGNTKCVDSISIQLSIDTKLPPDSANWLFLEGTKIIPGANFNLEATIPCLPIFEPFNPDTMKTIMSRVIIHRTTFNDTSQVYYLTILPGLLPITLEPCETNCPTLIFKWDSLTTTQISDSISFLIAPNYTDTLNSIGTVPNSDGQFQWNIPYNYSSEIVIRACSNSGCYQWDTLLTDFKPRYINTVSPNPFRPYHGELNVVYKIPSDQNVIVRIIDQGNRLVKELVSDQPRQKDIAYCEKWDGLNSKGELVANGMYYIVLQLTDGSRDIYPVFIRK